MLQPAGRTTGAAAVRVPPRSANAGNSRAMTGAGGPWPENAHPRTCDSLHERIVYPVEHRCQNSEHDCRYGTGGHCAAIARSAAGVGNCSVGAKDGAHRWQPPGNSILEIGINLTHSSPRRMIGKRILRADCPVKTVPGLLWNSSPGVSTPCGVEVREPSAPRFGESAADCGAVSQPGARTVSAARELPWMLTSPESA